MPEARGARCPIKSTPVATSRAVETVEKEGAPPHMMPYVCGVCVCVCVKRGLSEVDKAEVDELGGGSRCRCL